MIFRIDGHDIRPEAIDAVTVAEITLGLADEGTDKVARGKFEILINGLRITIYRAKRCRSGKVEGDAALAVVREEITKLRDSAVRAMMGHSYV